GTRPRRRGAPGGVAPLLLVGGVREERRHAHAEADLEVAARNEEARFLLRVDDLVDRGQRAAAPLGGPVQRREAGLRLAALEGLRALEPVPALASRVAA